MNHTKIGTLLWRYEIRKENGRFIGHIGHVQHGGESEDWTYAFLGDTRLKVRREVNRMLAQL